MSLNRIKLSQQSVTSNMYTSNSISSVSGRVNYEETNKTRCNIIILCKIDESTSEALLSWFHYLLIDIFNDGYKLAIFLINLVF